MSEGRLCAVVRSSSASGVEEVYVVFYRVAADMGMTEQDNIAVVLLSFEFQEFKAVFYGVVMTVQCIHGGA